jgi:hypothetical protein
MTYSLEEFCRDCHQALSADPGAGGREAIRRRVEKLLAEGDFVAAHLGPEVDAEKRLLHHDPDTGFYVFAHGTDKGDRVGKPHDHGASWAVYGQAIGVTEMTQWLRMDDGGRDGHAEIEPERRFRLDPGKAALFDTGTIHSTAHPLPARWIRVTGTDLDRIERYRYDPEKRTMQVMTPVA